MKPDQEALRLKVYEYGEILRRDAQWIKNSSGKRTCASQAARDRRRLLEHMASTNEALAGLRQHLFETSK